ncbi:MAG: LptF/LptG family permease [bacterium]
MKRLDRWLTWEVVRFTLLALLSVVAIYLLIDLFEELSYFTSRRVTLPVILLHYLYSMPAAISLLYPVSLLLAVFVVYGQMVRHRELHALESAGVRATRTFLPAAGAALLTVFGYLAANEFVTIPANAALSDLRRLRIERRTPDAGGRRRDVHFVGEAGRVYFVRELGQDGTMTDLSVKRLGEGRRVVERIDARSAVWRDSLWVAFDVTRRLFDEQGYETLTRYDTLALAGVVERPEDFSWRPRPIIETSTPDLRRFIRRLSRAGEDVAEQEVEYHYRFSYSLIGLVIVLLGLPLSIRMRRGGVMFGLGLGLLVSFLYWGAIQLSRAYGTSHVISPMLAAWLPNIVFGGIAALLWAGVRD